MSIYHHYFIVTTFVGNTLTVPTFSLKVQVDKLRYIVPIYSIVQSCINIMHNTICVSTLCSTEGGFYAEKCIPYGKGEPICVGAHT